MDGDDVSTKVMCGNIIIHNITVWMETYLSKIKQDKVEDFIEEVKYKEELKSVHKKKRDRYGEQR